MGAIRRGTGEQCHDAHTCVGWSSTQVASISIHTTALWEWSVSHLDDFWESIWQFFDVTSSSPYTAILESHEMPGASGFLARASITLNTFFDTSWLTVLP